MDLHGQIMNIQVESKKLGRCIDDVLSANKPDIESMLTLSYKIGHRDARHAAAELALDVPATPSEDARELVRRIQSHGIKLSKNASGQPVIMDVLTCPEEKGIALLSAYADSIRKQCVRQAVNDWFLNPRIDHNETTLEAAIMRKERAMDMLGIKIKDNDPRVGNRILTVIGLTETHVIARQGDLHPVRIRKDRIYFSSKPRKTGFTIINSQE